MINDKACRCQIEMNKKILSSLGHHCDLSHTIVAMTTQMMLPNHDHHH